MIVILTAAGSHVSMAEPLRLSSVPPRTEPLRGAFWFVELVLIELILAASSRRARHRRRASADRIFIGEEKVKQDGISDPLPAN